MMHDLEQEVYDEMIHNSMYHELLSDGTEVFIDLDHNVTIMDQYQYVTISSTDAIELEFVIREQLKNV